MDWKINFSKEAKNRTKEIITYLSEEWSVKTAQDFTNVLNNIENSEKPTKFVIPASLARFQRGKPRGRRSPGGATLWVIHSLKLYYNSNSL